MAGVLSLASQGVTPELLRASGNWLATHSIYDGSTSNIRSSTNIFLIWEGSELGLGHYTSLRTLLHHHPKDSIYIYSNTLDEDRTMQPFREHGFDNVNVVRYDCAALTAGTVAASFGALLQSTLVATKFNFTAAEQRLGTRWLRTQFSDWLRTVLLYRFGGLYVDFDVIIFRNLLQYRNLIGSSFSLRMQTCHTSYSQQLLRNLSHAHSLNIGGRSVRCVTDSLMALDRGHPWLRGVLQAAPSVFESCRHSLKPWAQYSCLTSPLYTGIAVALLPNVSLLSTVHAVDWSDLFCAMLDVGQSKYGTGSNAWWNMPDPHGELEKNVSRACYTWHRFSSSGAATKRLALTARKGTLGYRLLARHKAWPNVNTRPTPVRSRPSLGVKHANSNDLDGTTCQAGPTPGSVACL